MKTKERRRQNHKGHEGNKDEMKIDTGGGFPVFGCSVSDFSVSLW
jgi:hypothetical protein